MKNLLLSVLLISGFASCNNDSKMDTSNRDIQLLTDSSAYHNNVFSDTAVTTKEKLITKELPETPREVAKAKRNIPVKSRTAPVANTPQDTNMPPIAKVPDVKTPVENPPMASIPQSTTGSDKTTSGNNSNTGAIDNTPQVEKKKGWSKAAQGAAIGGATGAIGGAILSKKKGLGAVVGGIIGAAGGYIIGKEKDKKTNPPNLQ